MSAKTKKAFSIGEVMVAMFILLFGIISAVFLTARSIGSIGDSRNAAIASALAQEGTELIRNVRDNSVTQQTCGATGSERCRAFDEDTDYGWPSYTLGHEGIWCVVDYNIDGNHLRCSNSTPSDDIFINGLTGFFDHGQGGDMETPFRRRIYIQYDLTEAEAAVDPDAQIATVTSVILWGDKTDHFPSNVDNIESDCQISKKCAFAQTRLTSWINYGE